MVTISQALSLIDDVVTVGKTETSNLNSLVGRVIAAPVYAPIDLPPFRQSAMDGFAVCFAEGISNYNVKGELAAGSSETFCLSSGDAVRIFTGARVPESANAVIMQEDCVFENDVVNISDHIKPNQHIRSQGSQIKKDFLAFENGTLLTPSAVGFLSALGIDKMEVYRQPKIAIIATGSELVKPGKELIQGKIYESNSYMLKAAIEYYRAGNSEIFSVHDDLKATRKTIKEVMKWADFILLSGGISDGAYDFVARALHDEGVRGIFHKVKQKPGKPLYFGVGENNRYAFALPGNPSAAMTSFLIYVLPALRKFAGAGFVGLQKISGKIEQDYLKLDDRAHLLKAFTDEKSVRILDGQNSDVLLSFAQANSIAVIPEDENEIYAGDLLEIYLL